MNRVITKSAEGNLEPQFFTDTQLKDWYTEFTDETGAVTEEMILFDECEIKADKEGFLFVLTDYSADRDNERIDPDGWDFKQYKKNPVVFWAHQSYTPAIGKLTGLKKTDLKADSKKSIVGRVIFDQADPFAVLIEGKVKNGFISKGSVGFRSKKVEVLDEPGPDGVWLIHREQELYEFSIVNIPSNPNATVLSTEPDAAKELEALTGFAQTFPDYWGGGTSAETTTVEPEWEGKLDPKTSTFPDGLVIREGRAKTPGELFLDLSAKIDATNARLDAWFRNRDSSLSDYIFDENTPRETSEEQDRETSGLDHLFASEDESDSIQDLLNGG